MAAKSKARSEPKTQTPAGSSRDMALFWLGQIELQFEACCSVAIAGQAFHETCTEQDAVSETLFRVIHDEAGSAGNLNELRALLEALPTA
jgi:TolA-binding protein